MEEEKLMKEVYGDTWNLTKKFLSGEYDWDKYIAEAEKVSQKYKGKSRKQWVLARAVITGTTYYMEELRSEKS